MLKPLRRNDGMQIQWTTPTMEHQVRVVADQGTETSPTLASDTMVRVLCHYVIDHLPRQAHGELMSSLADMYDFYRQTPLPQHAAPSLAEPKKTFGKVTKSVRPEVSFPDEG